MTNFQIVQVIANGATALTFFAAAYQLYESNRHLKKSNLQKRSEYVANLYNTYINDKDMFDIYYKIEYGEFEYNGDFAQSTTERQVDKLLGHFSDIGRLFQLGILTKEDMKFFEYEFLVIYNDKGIQNYLSFLDRWLKSRKIKTPKFEYFRSTAKLLKTENYK